RRWDSNPRCSFWPHTPLAGEPLQPLGHVSEEFAILARFCRPPASAGAANHDVDQALSADAWSRPAGLCKPRPASSRHWPARTTTEVLISLVLIIWMLMPS